MKIHFFKSLLICVTLLFAVSGTGCTNRKEKDSIRKIKLVIDQNLNKNLNLPNDIITYKPFTAYLEDSSCIFNSPYKIVSYVNVSCGTCLGRFNKWNKVIPEFSKYEVPILILCGSVDDYQLFEFLCEGKKRISFPYPFFLDKKNEYLDLNSFMKENEDFQTVLVNREDKILLLGSPISSKKIKKLYLNKIKMLQKH